MRVFVVSALFAFLVVPVAAQDESKKPRESVVRQMTISARSPEVTVSLNLWPFGTSDDVRSASWAALPPADPPGPTALLLQAAKARVPALKDVEFQSPEEILSVSVSVDERSSFEASGKKDESKKYSTVCAVGINCTALARPTEVAEALADAVVEVMRERVIERRKGVEERQSQRIADANSENAKRHEQIKRFQDQQAALLAKMKKDTGRIHLTYDGVNREKDALETERQKLELDLAGLKARQEAINEAIADAGKRAKELEQTDPGVQVMRKLVDLSATNLSRVKKLREQQAASDSELAEAEDNKALAEAKLAERIAGLGASSEALTHWRQALIDAAIEQREKVARIDAATKRLATLIATEDDWKAMDPLANDEREMKSSLKQREFESASLSNWLENSKPEITVSKDVPRQR